MGAHPFRAPAEAHNDGRRPAASATAPAQQGDARGAGEVRPGATVPGGDDLRGLRDAHDGGARLWGQWSVGWGGALLGTGGSRWGGWKEN